MDYKYEQVVSKALSFLLRHKKEIADKYGYVSVNTILTMLSDHGYVITFEDLVGIVQRDEKGRYGFNWTNCFVRARQGHSYPVEIAPYVYAPPDFLYHGTSINNLVSIIRQGLLSMSRQHVHLSEEIGTAIDVGLRHTKKVLEDVVILTVRAADMHEDGAPFYLSDNNVWLADEVHPKYITLDYNIQTFAKSVL